MTLVSPYVEVVPLTRLKADLDFFTYEVPTDMQSLIQPGVLVEIPFRGRILQGIVVGYTQKPTYQLKSIRRVLEVAPLMHEWQLELTRTIADECFVSWATVLQACVPAKPLKKSTAQTSVEVDIPQAHELERAQQPFPVLVEQQTLVKYRTDAQKWQYVLDRVRATTGQVLILFPEKNDLLEALPYFHDMSDQLLIFDPRQGKHALWEQWQAIASGRSRVIMGTRSAAFAPVNTASLCVLIDEEHESHKQEEPNPRYHTTTVVDVLARILNTKVIRLTRAPRMLSLFRVAQGEMGFYDLGQHDAPPRVTVIDMNHELVAHNASMLGLQAQEAIRTASRSLVILNKKGYVTGFRCRDCERTGALEELMRDGRCPSCQSVRISSTGKGVEYAQQHLKELFPQARIHTLTKDEERSMEDVAALIEHAEIIIATDYVFSVSDLSPFSVIVDLSVDQQLALPSYAAQERAFVRLYGIAAQLTADQQFFVQTRHDEHPVITYAGQWNLKGMYLEEMAQRKQFGYPPFGRMMRLICKGATDEEALARTQGVIITLGNQPLTVGPPYPSQQTPQWHAYTIEVKLHQPLSTYHTFKSLPCIVDVDPV